MPTLHARPTNKNQSTIEEQHHKVSEESNKYKKQDIYFIKKLSLYLLMTGAIAWSLRDNIKDIFNQYNNSREFSDLPPPVARPTNFFSEEPPESPTPVNTGLSSTESAYLESYKLSCSDEKSKSNRNEYRSIPYKPQEVKNAYVHGMAEALPDALLPLIEAYCDELDEEDKERIMYAIQTGSFEKLTSHDLIQLLTPTGTIGVFLLVKQYYQLTEKKSAKEGEEEKLDEAKIKTLYTKINEVIKQHPEIVNERISHYSNDTLFSHVLEASCIYPSLILKDPVLPRPVTIDHTLLDLFIQSPQLYYPVVDSEFQINCFMRFIARRLKFNPDLKKAEKDKALLTTLATKCGINAQDRYGRTVLHHAIRSETSPPIVQYLIELKADPTIATYSYTYKDSDLDTWLSMGGKGVNSIITVPEKNALQYAQDCQAASAIITLIQQRINPAHSLLLD